MQGALAVLASLAALALVRADIPAHCLYDQVLGIWQLQLSANNFDNSVNCSKPITPSKLMKVTLAEPNVATTDSGATGTWTLVYDQGWELNVNGQSYWAFFSFTQLANGTVISYCGQMSNGWYHDNPLGPAILPKNWGCYSAQKVSSTKSVSLETVHTVPARLREEAHMSQVLQDDEEFAARINAAQSSWTATPKHGLGGRTLRAAAQRAGSLRLHERSARAQPRTEAALAATADLPLAWDWRSVNGASYVGPVRDQGQCGSCYTFGATNSYLARAKVQWQTNYTTLYSPQGVVSCSQYSQGCDGGFPYLVAKYGVDFGLVTEDCFPYASGNGTSPPCSQQCTDPSQRRFVRDYGYVGNFYGNCSEPAMRAEIYQYGPIPISFEVYPDFMHYSGGVYVHTGLQSKINPWEITNHVVMIVGWGHDDVSGLDYWIVMNSWGTDWGLDGYFLIARGVDECGIESIAVWNSPVQPQQ